MILEFTYEDEKDSLDVLLKAEEDSLSKIEDKDLEDEDLEDEDLEDEDFEDEDLEDEDFEDEDFEATRKKVEWLRIFKHSCRTPYKKLRDAFHNWRYSSDVIKIKARESSRDESSKQLLKIRMLEFGISRWISNMPKSKQAVLTDTRIIYTGRYTFVQHCIHCRRKDPEFMEAQAQRMDRAYWNKWSQEQHTRTIEDPDLRNAQALRYKKAEPYMWGITKA